MKKKILTTTLFLTITISSFLLGTTYAETVEKIIEVEVIPDGYIDTTTDEFFNNYIDMRQVTEYTATADGLQLYLEDGSGYYWER